MGCYDFLCALLLQCTSGWSNSVTNSCCCLCFSNFLVQENTIQSTLWFCQLFSSFVSFQSATILKNCMGSVWNTYFILDFILIQNRRSVSAFSQWKNFMIYLSFSSKLLVVINHIHRGLYLSNDREDVRTVTDSRAPPFRGTTVTLSSYPPSHHLSYSYEYEYE